LGLGILIQTQNREASPPKLTQSASF
jgi:hypothetical protein